MTDPDLRPISEFFALAGWREGQPAHPFERADTETLQGRAEIAAVLRPLLAHLTPAGLDRLRRSLETGLQEADDRDLGWCLLGRLPYIPPHPREFLSDLAAHLFPALSPTGAAHDQS